mmetsp:Transcript_12856/g.38789  ORF Transcript_12856/g.38789 Transcript_12856/m.38789 type:complete len:271 (-) Transcript_12856:474-1286(-)
MRPGTAPDGLGVRVVRPGAGGAGAVAERAGLRRVPARRRHRLFWPSRHRRLPAGNRLQLHHARPRGPRQGRVAREDGHCLYDLLHLERPPPRRHGAVRLRSGGLAQTASHQPLAALSKPLRPQKELVDFTRSPGGPAPQKEANRPHHAGRARPLRGRRLLRRRVPRRRLGRRRPRSRVTPERRRGLRGRRRRGPPALRDGRRRLPQEALIGLDCGLRAPRRRSRVGRRRRRRFKRRRRTLLRHAPHHRGRRSRRRRRRPHRRRRRRRQSV